MKIKSGYEVHIQTPNGRTRYVQALFDSIEEARAKVEYLQKTTLFKDSKFKVYKVEKTYTLVEGRK